MDRTYSGHARCFLSELAETASGIPVCGGWGDSHAFYENGVSNILSLQDK